MVKAFSTALVCGLALIGQSYAQEVFIGTQKTKSKSPAVQPVPAEQVKAEKAIAVQTPKSGTPASGESSAAKASTAAKQNLLATTEKKSTSTADTSGKLAGSNTAKGTPKSVAASAPSHETAAHSESKASGAIKEPSSKSATATAHAQPVVADKKSAVANDSVSKPTDAQQAKVTTKAADTLAAPSHLTSSLKTDATAALPLAAVPPPSKSKVALHQSATTAGAKTPPVSSSTSKKIATESATLKSEPVSPIEKKPEVAAVHSARPAATVENKSAGAVIKHPGVISAPEKATDVSTTALAKSPSQKGATVASTGASKSDTSAKAGSEKSRAMIAGMIAAQAEKQSIASVTPVTESSAPESTIPQPVNNHFDTAFTKLADGFDFPIGKPDAEGYYKARGFRSHGHLGEDWDGVRGGDTDLGDPIYSVADGLVVFARDCHMGWGNVLIVRHSYREGGTVRTVDALYGHLNSMLVHRGQAVTRGQKIATMGNAHGLYDAHLHLEIRKNIEIGMSRAAFAQDFSNYYDPTQFIQTHRHLQAGGGTYRVAMNTFTRDARIRWDKTRNYSHAHTGGGSSESAAALKKALAAKH